MVGEHNQLLFVNDACESLLGYRAEQLIGTLITDYMHPEDLAATIDSIQRVMNGQPHIDYPNRYLRKGSGGVHILWSACWYDVLGPASHGPEFGASPPNHDCVTVFRR